MAPDSARHCVLPLTLKMPGPLGTTTVPSPSASSSALAPAPPAAAAAGAGAPAPAVGVGARTGAAAAAPARPPAREKSALAGPPPPPPPRRPPRRLPPPAPPPEPSDVRAGFKVAAAAAIGDLHTWMRRRRSEYRGAITSGTFAHYDSSGAGRARGAALVQLRHRHMAPSRRAAASGARWRKRGMQHSELSGRWVGWDSRKASPGERIWRGRETRCSCGA